MIEHIKDSIVITGIMLRRSGSKVMVEAEFEGKWHPVITEFIDSNFSHIIEPSGMRLRVAEAGTGATDQ